MSHKLNCLPLRVHFNTFEIDLIVSGYYGNMCTTKRGTPQENGGI